VHAALGLLADGLVLFGPVLSELAVLDVGGGTRDEGLHACRALDCQFTGSGDVHVLGGLLGASHLHNSLEGVLVRHDFDVLDDIKVVSAEVFGDDFPEVVLQHRLVCLLHGEQQLLNALSAVFSRELLEQGVLVGGVRLNDGPEESGDRIPLALGVLGCVIGVELEIFVGLQ